MSAGKVTVIIVSREHDKQQLERLTREMFSMELDSYIGDEDDNMVFVVPDDDVTEEDIIQEYFN